MRLVLHLRRHLWSFESGILENLKKKNKGSLNYFLIKNRMIRCVRGFEHRGIVFNLYDERMKKKCDGFYQVIMLQLDARCKRG